MHLTLAVDVEIVAKAALKQLGISGTSLETDDSVCGLVGLLCHAVFPLSIEHPNGTILIKNSETCIGIKITNSALTAVITVHGRSSADVTEKTKRLQEFFGL